MDTLCILQSLNSYNTRYLKISSLCNNFHLLPTNTLNVKLYFDSIARCIFYFSKHFNTIYIFYDKSDKEFIYSLCVRAVSFFFFFTLETTFVTCFKCFIAFTWNIFYVYSIHLAGKYSYMIK